MDPAEYLKAGDLQSALQSLYAEIRKKPADAALRIFLFQLLLVLGEWQKAWQQANVAAELDSAAIPMKLMYQSLIQAEQLREAVFKGEKTPVLFGQPEQWMAELIEALKLVQQGHYQQAQSLREHAFQHAPASSGEIDGQSFDWIADADQRLGPILEVILEGRYIWIPFQFIRQIDIAEPEDLRDLVWIPAHFNWSNGGQSEGLIPSRYPFSYTRSDSALALSRKTEWQLLSDDFYIGWGTRLLATDQNEYSILDTRHIQLNG